LNRELRAQESIIRQLTAAVKETEQSISDKQAGVTEMNKAAERLKDQLVVKEHELEKRKAQVSACDVCVCVCVIVIVYAV